MALRIVCTSPAMNALSQTLVRCMSTQGASKNIGFVGLGNMGGHMASNLMKQGHKLHVFDISKQACDNLKAKGATVYEKTSDLAQKSDFVITMLPNNDIVANTYNEMTANGVNKDTIFIDSSTIDPNVVKSIQKMVSSKGARFIDAPVSGGVPGAEQATLTFMVGGTEAEYKAVKAVLECMGKRITHCGDYGMGQAAKICNNMMLGISMIGVSEAMNLAIRLGLNPQTFADIINSSTGRCWASELYNPVPGITATAPANNDYKGGFSTDLITKDLGLASGVATASNTPIPLGGMAHQIYRTLKSKGLGNKDFSVVYDFMKNEKHN
ncbi:probable 3-hydroxyisobutyrate dehydrogenase, mitochondrial [Teleopsis dalmanni]|uniref:probable 3-hydroxyisobutyrate dehydrogenase, mitochondrial n=1 Tax=Teleopsis dalmanni TaxID=139649 RepID=UPI0018CD1F37|nr:probable 3-hydroxyisobutyrate dehydrogenase, mitochondrial [Teleopsis dalmanni]XP_037953421.1 probable 3-hydroxyisobutyrate dehydrogenase, mitochondrial [Teleopsis dalmanni]